MPAHFSPVRGLEKRGRRMREDEGERGEGGGGGGEKRDNNRAFTRCLNNSCSHLVTWSNVLLSSQFHFLLHHFSLHSFLSLLFSILFSSIPFYLSSHISSSSFLVHLRSLLLISSRLLLIIIELSSEWELSHPFYHLLHLHLLRAHSFPDSSWRNVAITKSFRKQFTRFTALCTQCELHLWWSVLR